MKSAGPKVQSAKASMHPMLVSSPVVCFIGALLTDITYSQTAEMMWANFSVWLITFGLILAGPRHAGRPRQFSAQPRHS